MAYSSMSSPSAWNFIVLRLELHRDPSVRNFSRSMVFMRMVFTFSAMCLKVSWIQLSVPVRFFLSASIVTNSLTLMLWRVTTSP